MRITSACHATILSDCHTRRPDEACGLLFADAAGRVVNAVAVDNVWPEPTERPHRFAIDPLTQMKTEQAATTFGQSLVGFYHSHPTAPAVPSEFDRGRAWPVYWYVIVGFSDGESVEFRAWRLDESSAFVEHVVSIDG